jgi:hypothetical protein
MMFLTAFPLWLAGILLVGLPTLVAMSGLILIRRRVGLERLRTNNKVAGFKFATVGILYAVLLAFAVIVVWQKFGEAENNVAEEAGAAATIYRLSEGIDGETGARIRDALNAYLNTAIAEDWPAMERGEIGHSTTQALNAVYRAALTFDPADRGGAVLLADTISQLNRVGHARRARLFEAIGTVPGIVWLILLGGAAITVGFTFFFATEKSARPDHDDGSSDSTDLLRTPHHRRHRAPFCGDREGDTGASRPCPA